MSTRSTLTVRDAKGGDEAYSIYRHCDGYPDTEHGVFHTLRQALPYAWPLPRYEAMDFAAAIVAAWKRPAQARVFAGYKKTAGKTLRHLSQGGNIYFTSGREAHGDTEYHYEIYPGTNGKVYVECLEASYPQGFDGERVWTLRGRRRMLTAKMQPAVPVVTELS